MAQQTINVGTAPNDGTGTPLRTAFQYTNSNFSELYTALGGGSGLPGATTQVIFNDGGTNLAGDAGLVYNKTTDALTIGGNVQAASATITGNLTVDTNTLKVDSGTNNVSIGGLVNKVTGVSGSGTGLTIQASAGPTLGIWDTTDPSYFTNLAQVDANCYLYNNAAGALLFGVGNVEAMRLNSNGLGVGVSPSYKLDIFGTVRVGTANPIVRLETGTNTGFIDYNDTRLQLHAGPLPMYFVTGSTLRMTLDATGNLGIGVTPAGTGGCLQLKSGITFPATQVASSDVNTLDDYVEGTFTPVIQGVSTAGTGTYTVQSGRYTKIGNRVFVDIFLNWTAHTGTGAMLIANLPFTIKNASNYYPSVTFGQLNNIALAANSVLTGYGTFNTKTLNLDQYPVGGGATSSVQMDPSGSIVCSVCYEV